MKPCLSDDCPSNSDDRILSGKELKKAAKEGLKVRYMETHEDPYEEDWDEVCVMEACDGSGYYIGGSDIEPDEFPDDALVSHELDDGMMSVRVAPGVDYS